MQISSPRPRTSNRPSRGDLWLVDFGTPGMPGGPVGHEQGYRRPALIVSVDTFNRTGDRVYIAVPLTSRGGGLPTHVPVHPPEGNLTRLSFVRCEQVRLVAVERVGRYVGELSATTLAAVEHRLRLLMAL